MLAFTPSQVVSPLARRPYDLRQRGGLALAQLRTWLEFSLTYIDMKWPNAAPSSRDGLAETIATVSPALVREDTPEAPDARTLREALRAYYLAPQDRERARPARITDALTWLEKASLEMPDVAQPSHVRAALNALSLRLDGKPAAAAASPLDTDERSATSSRKPALRQREICAG